MMATAAGGALGGTGALSSLLGAGATTKLALGAQVGSILMEGIGFQQQAEAERKQAEINAKIGETRAWQTDTVARQDMESDLGTARAVMGANAQRPNVGTFEMLRGIRDTKNRERRIQYGAQMQQAQDFRTQADNIRQKSRWIMPRSLMKAGPSIFDLYQTMR